MLRQGHRAGEKTFVDYAGATIPVDHATGELDLAAASFVACQQFAEATTGQDLAQG